MLLLGLALQSDNERKISVVNDDDSFAQNTDSLFREFHDRLIVDATANFVPSNPDMFNDPNIISLIGREAIYYGADGFYLHQYLQYSRQRYRSDTSWFQENIGLSIRPMIDIANFILKRINLQISALSQVKKEEHNFGKGDLTNSLIISKSDIRKKFKSKADVFFDRFSSKLHGENLEFTEPFAVNRVNFAPLIDLGDYLYVPNQYRLTASLYESPFYWMIADKHYQNVAAQNRGDFLEESTTKILQKIFGSDHVFQNVTIYDGSKDKAGEVDVLVAYGEFVLVVQAKSKRITQKARSGDQEALRTDFDGAIGAPYRQALDCAKLILKGAECRTSDGKVLTFQPTVRLFPVVVLSDQFPASSHLSNFMLERGGNMAPAIWDLGILDCVCRILPSPIELIFYLKCRTEVFDLVHSDSEYNFLGYHLKAKLVLPEDADGMVIDRDFASIVDDYMVSCDVNAKPERPKGILERFDLPVIFELLDELKNAPPEAASVAIDLYDFSYAALRDFSETIVGIRSEVLETGKAIKAFSIPTRFGGLTYAVTQARDATAMSAAEAIGRKHKYDTKSDYWYVILDSVQTDNPIDGMLSLVWEWTENENEERVSQGVNSMFKSWKEQRIIGQS